MNCRFGEGKEGIQQVNWSFGVETGGIQQISVWLCVGSRCLLVMVASVQGRVLGLFFLRSGSNFLCTTERFANEHCLWEVHSLRNCVLLVRETYRWRWLWSIYGNILIGEDGNALRETYPIATWSTKNITCLCLGSKLDFPVRAQQLTAWVIAGSDIY